MPYGKESTILLKDPLSKETRIERRNLLGASAMGIIIVKTGLVPSKISALGIEFNQADQRSLLLAIAAVIFYFLIAFLIYAISDFLIWRLAFRDAVSETIAEARRRRSLEHGKRTEEENYLPEYVPKEKPSRRKMFLYMLPTPVSGLRAVFEFALPILISVYAVIVLIGARV